MADRQFIAASDSFLSYKEPIKSTILVSSSMFVEAGNKKKPEFAVKAFTENVFGRVSSFESASASLTSHYMRPACKVYGSDSFVANASPNMLSAPSLDAFMYIRSKTEVGMQTEVEGAFNTKEGVFFWG